jgi:predicted phosphoribosyltransferase
VPVAFEVAQALDAPLDVFVVRKLGVPGYEELAMGAIASGGVHVENPGVIKSLKISPDAVDRVAAAELEELRRRERQYCDDRPPPEVRGRTVVLIDDGLATGASMAAAAIALRRLRPGKLIIAVPVAARETCEQLSRVVDQIVCVRTPADFGAVGLWYQDFTQTTDEEVRELLRRNLESRAAVSA